MILSFNFIQICKFAADHSAFLNRNQKTSVINSFEDMSTMKKKTVSYKLLINLLELRETIIQRVINYASARIRPLWSFTSYDTKNNSNRSMSLSKIGRS